MTPTRSQLDAAEAWLLAKWRCEVLSFENRTSLRRQGARHAQAAVWRANRYLLATAVRAIRAIRKALDAEAPPVRKTCDGCEFLWHGSEGARGCHHPSTSGPVGTPRVAAHKPPPEWCPLRKGAA